MSAKCSDLCNIEYADGTEEAGVIDPQIGVTDYIRFAWCTVCGHIQGIINEHIPNGA